MRISDTQAEHLLKHGYVIVPSFLTADELSAARENMFRYYPSAEELSATPERYGGIHEEPESLQNEFPFAGDTLNHISTHPELIAFIEKVLGTRDVLLSQADDVAHHLDVEAGALGLVVDVLDIARERRLLLLEPLDALDEGLQLLARGKMQIAHGRHTRWSLTTRRRGCARFCPPTRNIFGARSTSSADQT